MSNKLKNVLIQQGADYAARLAGDYFLDKLTKGKFTEEDRIKPFESDKSLRKRAGDFEPKYRKKDIPGVLGAQTIFGSAVENPVETAIFAKNVAPFAGMAVAGTALDMMFGGKPQSQYSVPVGRRGMTDPGANQNVLASNVSTANEAYLMNLKQQHAIDLIYAKQQAATPGVQNYGRAVTGGGIPSGGSELEQYQSMIAADLDRQGRPALNEEAKEIARALYGTGLKAF
tara:strand:+ start:50 stop:736 length:687 start_codon:yes stop_codon:yes gene_type:complete